VRLTSSLLVIPQASLATLIGLAAAGHAMQGSSHDLLTRVDHLVYATPDLEVGIKRLEDLLGVRATPGGQHPGLGTRNALIALGPSTYIEVIGPDPDQPRPAGPLRFHIDDLEAPRLIGWVAKGIDLGQFVSRAGQSGIALGEVISGSRKRPDGVLLSWRYTDPNVVIADRLVPYFIDWGKSPHPAATATPGVTLVALRAEHPDAARVQSILDRLGLDLQVQTGPKPALIATLDSPKGRVQLRP
jgi:hypothetical protein